MNTGHPSHPHHSGKFYLLMITLVVGSILALLLINDQGEFSLTGSSVGVLGGEGEAAEKEALEELKSRGERGEKVEIKLDFDTAPEVKGETKLKLVELVFDDLSSRIKINEEELELKDLEKVEMSITNFKGEVDFDGVSISLKGEGEKLVINGIEISTKGKMAISFSKLVYESLKIGGIKLELMEFGKGSGKLALGERLKYEIENEKIKLSNFEGDLGIGGNKENLVILEGKVGGVVVEGELDLTLG